MQPLSSVKEKEIRDDYLKTLQDLTFNSKPLIDVLTEIAEENKEYASTISECILEQLENVAEPLKLPILYLVDSIIKKVGQYYMYLFFNKIDKSFTNVYQQGDENMRNKLLKLRFTWNNVVPYETLSSLDKMVQAVNPSWPNAPSVHVNPKFVSISNAQMTSINCVTTHSRLTISNLTLAEKRQPDPRIRGIEPLQIKVNDNNISPLIRKEAKTTLASSRTDPRIDFKNGRRYRYQTKVEEKIVDSKSTTKNRVEVKIDEESGDVESLKKHIDDMKPREKDKTNYRVRKNKIKSPTSKWSKEKREEVMKAFAESLSKSRERDKVMESLSKTHPEIKETLLTLIKLEEEDLRREKSPNKRTSVKDVSKILRNDRDCDEITSPKPTLNSRVTITTSVECSLSSSTVSSTTSFSGPNSGPAVNPMNIPSTVVPFAPGILPSPFLAVPPILSIPPPPLPLPLPPLIPSPVIPIPPPAPIISSSALAAEATKSRDIDYRQIFGLQFLQGSQVASQSIFGTVESSTSKDTQVDNVDEISPKSNKREVPNKRENRDVKRKRTDDGDSDESACSMCVENIGDELPSICAMKSPPAVIVSRSPSPIPSPPQFHFPVLDDLPTSSVPFVPTTTILTNDSSNPPVTTELSNISEPNDDSQNLNILELLQKLVANGLLSNTEDKPEDDDTIREVDFEIPSTLKQKQPGMVKMLHIGIPCDSCGQRFTTEQTREYGQHLDWHYRLKRKRKDGTLTIHSRKWYYGGRDWMTFQEIEDTSERGTSWFDNQHLVTEYTEEILQDVPCVPTGSHTKTSCELCKTRFEQFYYDEGDEWLLRNAVKIDNFHYHASCFQEYQEKSKSEKAAEESLDEPNKSPELAETSESTEMKNQSDDESADSDIEDVQLIEKPIEEIIINDDANDLEESNLETIHTEDMVTTEEDISQIKDIESTPIKEHDEVTPELNSDKKTSEVHSPRSKTFLDGVITMDGNIELANSPAQIIGSSVKIKINIGKNLIEDGTQSLQNGELEMTNNVDNKDAETKSSSRRVKSRIEDASLTTYPTVTAGCEKSGLCSIM